MADHDEQPTASAKASLAFKKRRTIWHGMLVGGLLGTMDELAALKGLNSDWWMAEGLAEALFALRWCALDSEDRGRRLGRWMGLTIFLIVIVGVPVYLLRSRGMWRGLVACAAFVSFLCLLFGLEWLFAIYLMAISDWCHGGTDWGPGE